MLRDGRACPYEEEHDLRRQKARNEEGSRGNNSREQSRVMPIRPRSHHSQTEDLPLPLTPALGRGNRALGLGQAPSLTQGPPWRGPAPICCLT